MKRMGKFVAVVASIALFVMPVAAMPLHCLFSTSSGAASGEADHSCHHMMETSSAPTQFAAASPNHSCCQVSAGKPEAITAAPSPAGKEIVAPPTTIGLVSDLAAAQVRHERFDWAVSLPGGPPLAVLCTFVI